MDKHTELKRLDTNVCDRENMGSCFLLFAKCVIFRAPYLALYRTVFDDFGVVFKRSLSAFKRPKIVENGSVQLKIRRPKDPTTANNRKQ